MIPSLLITLREGLEAALIVCIILGYLKKTSQLQYARYAWAGVGLAVALSVGLALVIRAAGTALEGQAEQIFEGTLMLLTAAMLTWMIFWMQSQSRQFSAELTGGVQTAMQSGHPRGLFTITFLAVMREGIETALFLATAAIASDGASTLIGAIIGLAVAVLIGYLVYTSTARLNLKLFFSVTSFLLLAFAAGLFAHGVHEFQEAGIVPVVIEHVWNVNHILDEDATVGGILKAVFGYNGNPSLIEVIAYWAYWGFALFGMRWLVERRSRMVQTARAAA